MLFILMFLLQIWRVTKRSGMESNQRYGVQSQCKVTWGLKHRLTGGKCTRTEIQISTIQGEIKKGKVERWHLSGYMRDSMQSLSQTDSHTPPETVSPLLWSCSLWQQPSFHRKGNPYLAIWQDKHIDEPTFAQRFIYKNVFLHIKQQNLYILSFDLSAVSWGSRVDHRLVIVEYNVLSAKFDILISLQITLAPLCRRK